MLAAGSFADEASPRPKANTLDEGMLSPRSAEFARFGKRRNSAFAEESWDLWSIQFSVSKTKLTKWISSRYENLSEAMDILNLDSHLDKIRQDPLGEAQLWGPFPTHVT